MSLLRVSSSLRVWIPLGSLWFPFLGFPLGGFRVIVVMILPRRPLSLKGLRVGFLNIIMLSVIVVMFWIVLMFIVFSRVLLALRVVVTSFCVVSSLRLISVIVVCWLVMFRSGGVILLKSCVSFQY